MTIKSFNPPSDLYYYFPVTLKETKFNREKYLSKVLNLEGAESESGLF